ncbi:MAG TPA: DUF4340 domain-containing protein [Candidatus Hydrogenedentes bacterium]|nr:DUF4340 domain-containing protein [Candidatus Hydrogenedentota bacterium]
MSWKKLVPLVVIIVVLGGLATWKKSSQRRPESLAVQARLETLVPQGISKDEIVKIELYAGSKPDEKVVIQKQGSDWTLTSLYDAPANAETVNRFLDGMLGLKGEFRATADSDEKLALYNLKDDQSFVVRLYRSGSDDPAFHLLVGKAPDFKSVFMRRAGENKVFVEAFNPRREAGVTDSGDDAVPRGTRWLKTELLKLEQDKIAKVAITMPDKSLVFERHEKPSVEQPAQEAAGQDANKPEEKKDEKKEEKPKQPEYEWKLASGGFAQTFSDPELKTLLGRFTNLYITDVVDPSKKAEYGLEPPQYKVVVTLDSGEETTLLGGRDKPGGETYVTLASDASGRVYKMSKYNFEQIFIKGSPLFSLPGLTLNKDDLNQVEIESPEGKIVLARDDQQQWQVREPAVSLQVKKQVIDDLVNAVCAVKPADYADPSVDIGPLSRKVTLRAGGATHELLFGSESKHIDGTYLRIDGKPENLALAGFDVKKILVTPTSLYDLAVLKDLDKDASRVEVASPDVSYALFKEGDNWKLIRNGETTDAKAHAAEDLLSEIAVVAPQAFRVDDGQTFQAVTKFVVTTTSRAVTVDFSEPRDGVRLARVSDRPGVVFEVKADDVTSLFDQVAESGKVPEPPAPAPAQESSTPTPAQESSAPAPAPANSTQVETSQQQSAPAQESSTPTPAQESSAPVPAPANSTPVETSQQQSAPAQPVDAGQQQ